MVKGKVSSVQSLGTVDGPGVRYVVFLQGCPLNCGCCHNPETRFLEGGTEYTSEELVAKIEKCKEYFGERGGVTLSGGEPLLQPEFCEEIFSLCHSLKINTCLDTSGCILNHKVKALLDKTDLVLLDIKYTESDKYLDYVGCEMEKPLEFLDYLNSKGIPTVIRQVIIPTLNDSDENIQKLNELKDKYSCVEKIELLPFKKLCTVKYEKLGLVFPFNDFNTPTEEKMSALRKLIK